LLREAGLKRKRLLAGSAIAAIIGFAFCLAFYFDLLHTVQQQSSDFLFRAANLYQGTEATEKIVVVGIDDKSLEQLGRFSLWPRSHHAQLIDALTEAKARVITFDVLFSEPAPGDSELAVSIRNAGNVILPIIYTSTANAPTATHQAEQAKNIIRPLEILAEGATALGHANLIPDADGVVRRVSIAVPSGDDYEASLALASVAEYLRRPVAIESSTEDNLLHFAGRSIPISGNKEMLINYVGSPQETEQIVSYETVSFVDILNGETDLALFQDRIVIIGATASGFGDTFWTPVGRMMNGIEIHANAIHTILTGSFLKPAHSAVTIALTLVLALLCGIAVLRLRALWAILSVVFSCVAYFLVGFSFFDNGTGREPHGADSLGVHRQIAQEARQYPPARLAFIHGTCSQPDIAKYQQYCLLHNRNLSDQTALG